MAFIAVTAKADLLGEKKGKITPAHHAQLNAWTLASKTGILDWGDHCEPTSGSFQVMSGSVSARVTFKKGYIVICGRLVECEAGSFYDVAVPSVGTTTGSIILRYSLGNSGNQEFEVTTKSGSLTQEDLNDNPINGVYEFELCSYTADSSTQTVTVSRDVEYIPDIGGKLSNFIDSLTTQGKPLYQYDQSKGTIEERLTNLGFRQGSIIGTNISNATLTRQGNYVIGSLIARGEFSFTLPAGFRPKEIIASSFGGSYYSGGTKVFGGILAFQPSGEVVIRFYGDYELGTSDISFGFEADPWVD